MSCVPWWYCNISSSSERSQCSKAVKWNPCYSAQRILVYSSDSFEWKELKCSHNFLTQSTVTMMRMGLWWRWLMDMAIWVKSAKKNTHNIRPGRLLLRFFEPKSLTRENKLSLLGFSQFPMLLLGLLAQRLALAFSRSLACLFCRMRELAIAAAVASLAFRCRDASQIKNDHMLCMLKSCVLRTLSRRKKNQYSMTDCVMVISEVRCCPHKYWAYFSYWQITWFEAFPAALFSIGCCSLTWCSRSRTAAPLLLSGEKSSLLENVAFLLRACGREKRVPLCHDPTLY